VPLRDQRRNCDHTRVAAANNKGRATRMNDQDRFIWNVATRTEMYRYSLPTRHGLTAVFSPGGNALVVGERGCGKVLLCTE